jgi:HAD superfamily hydrolase (TIGR01490 family)
MNTGSEKLRGAFFDVDYTVLSNNSATLFVKYLRKEGKVGLKELAFTLYWVVRYKLNLVDFEEVAVREVAKMAGESEREMIELCDRWFSEMVVDYIYSDARALIEEHKRLGDPVVLLSAATVYLVRPLAEHLGIEHYLCNRLEVDDEGRFTGGLIRPFSYGEGKILLAEKFAVSHGLDLSASLYYSDSITDLPVLERFGEPRVVNPDLLLRKEAGRRGWPVLEFKA